MREGFATRYGEVHCIVMLSILSFIDKSMWDRAQLNFKTN